MAAQSIYQNLGHAIVVIPALNPDPALPDYVTALLSRGFAQIVVVNDGSAPACDATFEALDALDGCTVLYHEFNQGKGRALKTAFAYIRGCVEWTGMAVVTADADFQHTVEDVCTVAQAAVRERDRLVMGVRDLSLPNVPTRSKVGNHLTSWAFHLLYGVRLGDTQTGLRGIPWERLQWCVDIKGDRFEYEMNVLIQASRDHVALRQVEIQTVYYDNNKGTHLRAVRDSWRVARVLFSGLGWYTAAAAISAASDVVAFWLGSSWLFGALSGPARYWWSTLTARSLSSSINYTMNRKYVFVTLPSRRTLVRYYALWLGQMMASYLLVLTATALLPGAWPVGCKIAVDLLLALCSYQVQMHWVFKEDDDDDQG